MHFFTAHQLNQLKSKGISLETVNAQLSMFRKGIEPVLIDKPAIPGDGIEVFNENEENHYIRKFRDEAPFHSVIKFVPSSGAASRMFKLLFEFQNDIHSQPNIDLSIESNSQIKHFFNDLNKYPFFYDLEEICTKKGINVGKLLSKRNYKEILDLILNPAGLNYGVLPKALLKFHLYGNDSRTSFHEHLIEASGYLKDDKGRVNMHFTISPEHRAMFKKHADQLTTSFFNQDNTDFSLSFSEQHPSTDTIAVSIDNQPFIIDGESLYFRPGGHGALINNLQDIKQSIVFIGNIDNVAPDRIKPLRIKYKQLLGGVLLERVQKIHSILEILEKGLSGKRIQEITDFIRKFISDEKARQFDKLKGDLLIKNIHSFLNRPIRVCGMVKNTGEPGGGPFWIISNKGEISKQIIESSQINMNDKYQKELFNSSTHFNPVNMACYIKDYKGRAFRLNEFVDPEMAFISIKSQEGRALKALELPGLWNGAMAGWLTFFIEVPKETFSPVKTVFDLLRPEHLSHQ